MRHDLATKPSPMPRPHTLDAPSPHRFGGEPLRAPGGSARLLPVIRLLGYGDHVVRARSLHRPLSADQVESRGTEALLFRLCRDCARYGTVSAAYPVDDGSVLRGRLATEAWEHRRRAGPRPFSGPPASITPFLEPETWATVTSNRRNADLRPSQAKSLRRGRRQSRRAAHLAAHSPTHQDSSGHFSARAPTSSSSAPRRSTLELGG